ncbi:hypothetical protein CROQUDRAFT_663456, partial [Cronartium quercuum f. sp. fusiforme G11]
MRRRLIPSTSTHLRSPSKGTSSSVFTPPVLLVRSKQSEQTRLVVAHPSSCNGDELPTLKL